MNDLARHVTTRSAYKQFLHHYFGEFVKREWISKNPFDNTKLPKKRTTENLRHFTPKERALLKAHLSAYFPELWLFVQCMYYTLIRPNELRLLLIKDIDLEETRILVRAENAKNGLNQFVKIPDPFKEALQAAI
ncbi:MAG: hypothetical protein OHK0053_14530 [Microscillaceae bacterium]